MAQAGADAVGAGVAAADHHHIFAGGVEAGVAAVKVVVELVAGVAGEKLHREVHAFGVAIFDRQIATEGGTAAEHDRIEILAEFFSGPLRVLADVDAGFENDAFGSEQVDAALDDQLLVELHVGDAVHQ